jgi:predicted porin
MKKSILAIAVVAASIAAPAAMAAPTVYGNIHLAVVDADSNDNLDLTSQTSAIGIKGSEDLGDGLKAIYKAEFQVDASDGGWGNASSATTTCEPAVAPDGPVCTTTTSTTSNGNALTQRDIFVGLKGGMGTVKFGTFSSNYKQKGGKVDSLYRTPVEGRGFIKTQSNLHNGRAINRGRMTNALSYTSPKMGGIELVVNTTMDNVEEETIGAGLRWSNKSIMLFADWIDLQPTTAPVVSGATDTESAMKVGGKFSTKAFHIGGQFESAEDVTGFDYIHVNGGFNFNKNSSIQVTVGTATHITDSAKDTESFAVAYNHKLSKMTNVYVAYGDKSSDTAASEDDALAFGIKKKF